MHVHCAVSGNTGGRTLKHSVTYTVQLGTTPGDGSGFASDLGDECRSCNIDIHSSIHSRQLKLFQAKGNGMVLPCGRHMCHSPCGYSRGELVRENQKRWIR